jgi:hypothetical protein
MPCWSARRLTWRASAGSRSDPASRRAASSVPCSPNTRRNHRSRSRKAVPRKACRHRTLRSAGCAGRCLSSLSAASRPPFRCISGKEVVNADLRRHDTGGHRLWVSPFVTWYHAKARRDLRAMPAATSAAPPAPRPAARPCGAGRSRCARPARSFRSAPAPRRPAVRSRSPVSSSRCPSACRDCRSSG